MKIKQGLFLIFLSSIFVLGYSRSAPFHLTVPTSDHIAATDGKTLFFAGGQSTDFVMMVSADDYEVYNTSGLSVSGITAARVSSLAGDLVIIFGDNKIETFNLTSRTKTSVTLAPSNSWLVAQTNGHILSKVAFAVGGFSGNGALIYSADNVSMPPATLSLPGPTMVNYGTTTALVNGHLYTAFVGGDVSGIPLNSILIFNHTSESFVTHSMTLSDVRANVHAIAVDHYLVVIGGGSTAATAQLVEIFDLSNMLYVNNMTLSHPRAHHAVAKLGHYIYVAGGSFGSSTNLTEMIDTRTWTVSFAENLTRSSARLTGISTDRAVFFAGGVDNSFPIADVNYYRCGNYILDDDEECDSLQTECQFCRCISGFTSCSNNCCPSSSFAVSSQEASSPAASSLAPASPASPATSPTSTSESLECPRPQPPGGVCNGTTWVVSSLTVVGNVTLSSPFTILSSVTLTSGNSLNVQSKGEIQGSMNLDQGSSLRLSRNAQLQVTDNMTITAASSVRVEANGSIPSVRVGGTARLAGTLEVSIDPESKEVEEGLPIIVLAAEAVLGTFATVAVDMGMTSPCFFPSVSYVATAVQLITGENVCNSASFASVPSVILGALVVMTNIMVA